MNFLCELRKKATKNRNKYVRRNILIIIMFYSYLWTYLVCTKERIVGRFDLRMCAGKIAQNYLISKNKTKNNEICTCIFLQVGGQSR